MIVTGVWIVFWLSIAILSRKSYDILITQIYVCSVKLPKSNLLITINDIVKMLIYITSDNMHEKLMQYFWISTTRSESILYMELMFHSLIQKQVALSLFFGIILFRALFI